MTTFTTEQRPNGWYIIYPSHMIRREEGPYPQELAEKRAARLNEKLQEKLGATMEEDGL